MLKARDRYQWERVCARDECACKELEPATASPITCRTGHRYESRRNPPHSRGEIVRGTRTSLLRVPGVQLVYPVIYGDK